MKEDKYLQMFLEEVREHLSVLNEGVLELEKRPDAEVLNQVFRSFHTIKGMSATMGYETLANLSHGLENILDEVRNGRREVSEELVDVLLESLDLVESCVSTLENGGNGNIDVTGVLKRIDLIRGDGADAKMEEELTQRELDTLASSLTGDSKLFKIVVELDQRCNLKSVRAFMVFKEVNTYGEVVKCCPEAEKIEDGEFDLSFTLYIMTKKSDREIVDSLTRISEVANVHLSRVALKPKKSLEGGGQKKRQITSVQSIRVPVERLDNLMNLVGELVITKSRLTRLRNKYELEELNETVSSIERMTADLQDEVMEMRMVEVAFVFDRFPRMVRDLARAEGKLVDFIIEGREIKLDRTVLDEIGEPLVHLLRNSVDHGIEAPEARKDGGKVERGTVKLIARREKKYVEITVEDDGRGINLEKIKKIAVEKGIKTEEEVKNLSDKEALQLIFVPGLSSALKVTDVSGRGVGMDVVKSKISSLGGIIDIESQYGKGTRVTLRLPITLAITQSLLVAVNGETFAIPLGSVMETLRLGKGKVKTMMGGEVFQLRGSVLPFIRLGSLLGRTAPDTEEYKVVIVENNGQSCGLQVDKLLGQHEIVIKPLDSSIRETRGFGGATILGDGRVALILDIPTLVGGG
jgi:two-component system chemotaxis sensor kinase CheA